MDDDLRYALALNYKNAKDQEKEGKELATELKPGVVDAFGVGKHKIGDLLVNYAIFPAEKTDLEALEEYLLSHGKVLKDFVKHEPGSRLTVAYA